jgi:hypothetical protein
MQDTLNYHLFGGEHAYCLPGMDGYVSKYDDIETAMRIAEGSQFDWAHIVQVTPVELKIVNVGRWNAGLKQMVWQASYAPSNKRDTYLWTFLTVMKTGIMLLGQLSGEREHTPKARIKIMTTGLNLYDEIQDALHDMTPEASGIAVYLIRQVIAQLMASIQRPSMNRKQEQARKQWVHGASHLLKETEKITYAVDRLEAV